MIKSEWIKLWSVRSTWIALACVLTFMAGIATAYSVVIKPGLANPADALQGASLGQLAAGTLGVLVISSEFSTGLIRTTFATVPRRRKVVAAKAALLFAVLAVVGEAAAFLAWFIAQIVLGHRHVSASLSDPGMLPSVLGVGFYLTFIGMFGFCLGVLLRKTVAALSAFFGIVFIGMGLIANLMPDRIKENVVRLTFLKVGEAMSTPARALPRGATDNLLSPGAAWQICLLYLVIVVALPLLLVNRRDAG